MCDFAVWNGQITRKDVEYLGLECGVRNRDATGVSFTVDNSIKTLKGPVAANEFFSSSKWKELWYNFGNRATNGMVHCRIATHGSPEDNVNNHPHVTESGSILVHKGIVKPVTYMEDAISACDSEQLIRSLDFYGIEQGIQNVSGWAHLAYVPFYDHDSMFLYSNSSPLEYHEFVDSLVVVNTSTLTLDDFEHDRLDSTELDLDTVYSLNLDSNFYGELDVWKRDVKLNGTHKSYFGKSEKVFRSNLNVNH